ncbi:MAG: hydroxymethylpyrimidine/phosphomethylpyrimidine kinase [Candidatus Eremiobacteraeota bacterium]|nr:hydroxymethylpyrimidine/phosphomethylpyrimidine kinase [Candidatus Eremiobacteraeota bacterium]
MIRPRISVCSIGSTDPTTNAGICADVRHLQAFGVAPTVVVTGVTAQNSGGVAAVAAMRPQLIISQLECVWRERIPDAVRIGLVPSRAGLGALTSFLEALPSLPPLLIDPVLSSSSGARLLGAKAVPMLVGLLAQATLVTPNAPEAAELSGLPVDSVGDAERAALRLSEYGCAVLVKGGHLGGAVSTDVLASDGRLERFTSARISAVVRGTGCALAAAIAARLALGDDLRAAVLAGRAYVRRWIRTATGSSTRHAGSSEKPGR